MRIAAVLLLVSMVPLARAHNGPPFAIMVDRKIGPCMVSVWSNPDVGTGTFFVMLDAPPGGKIPSDVKVEIGVQPVSGRLPEARYTARRADMRGQVEYDASAPFDKQELWRIRTILTSSEGGGEGTVTVEVTPPGYGRWDLLLYVLPFVGAGFLWARAILRKRRAR
jgi:hypothetical protein